MKDDQVRLSELRDEVRRFVEERDWNQFHTPKNLVMAMSIEVAELMEHFQWLTPAESRQLAADEQARAAVAEELSDVFCYVMALANELDIDLAAAFRRKMVQNRAKYPADEFRGRYEK